MVLSAAHKRYFEVVAGPTLVSPCRACVKPFSGTSRIANVERTGVGAVRVGAEEPETTDDVVLDVFLVSYAMASTRKSFHPWSQLSVALFLHGASTAVKARTRTQI